MPTTLAELETWRKDWVRRLALEHCSELEDADERHKARCEALNKYFVIRSHELVNGASLLACGHAWETWTSGVSVLCADYAPRAAK
jgi:hypothetical protein